MSKKEEEMMVEITKSCKSVSKNSVEQTAYFPAMGEKNNLNLDKHRTDVEGELSGTKKGNGAGAYMFHIVIIYFLIFLCQQIYFNFKITV